MASVASALSEPQAGGNSEQGASGGAHSSDGQHSPVRAMGFASRICHELSRDHTHKLSEPKCSPGQLRCETAMRNFDALERADASIGW